MKHNQSFNAQVEARNNGLEIGDIVCLKVHEQNFRGIISYAQINRQNGTDTGVYIDANEFKNSFVKLDKDLNPIKEEAFGQEKMPVMSTWGTKS